MANQEDDAEEKTGVEAGQAERRAMYPEEGYVLVEIDMWKPPGEALGKIGEYDSLTEISMPAATDDKDYVVYDSAGNAFTHDDL